MTEKQAQTNLEFLQNYYSGKLINAIVVVSASMGGYRLTVTDGNYSGSVRINANLIDKTDYLDSVTIMVAHRLSEVRYIK